MRRSDPRPSSRSPRSRNIRLIARCEARDLQRLLDGRRGGDRFDPAVLEHGRLGRHLVVELPAWFGVDDLAGMLTRLEQELPGPLLAVVALEQDWLVIEAVEATDPVSRAVADIDGTLAGSGFPPGAATMPLRELDDPGTITAALPG